MNFAGSSAQIRHKLKGNSHFSSNPRFILSLVVSRMKFYNSFYAVLPIMPHFIRIISFLLQLS